MNPIEGKSYSFHIPVTTEVIETKGEKKYIVKGYISSGKLDKVNDIVTKSCMEDMLTQIKTGNIKLDIEHEAYKDNPNILPTGRLTDGRIDAKGLFITAELNQHSPKFQAAWGSLQNRMLDGFSITYKAINATNKIVGGVKARLLDKLDLRNVALTGNAVDKFAGITDVLMKSLSDMEETTMAEEDNKAPADGADNADEKAAEDAKVAAEAKVAEEAKKVEEAATAEKEAAETEAKNVAAQKKKEKEAEEEDDDKKKVEAKALEDKVGKLEAEVKALNLILEKPQFKALQEEAENKSVDKPVHALDII